MPACSFSDVLVEHVTVLDRLYNSLGAKTDDLR
jgi:hypothetical protein